MLQGEHSAIHLTFIKLSSPIKTFVLSFFNWPLKTGVHCNDVISGHLTFIASVQKIKIVLAKF